MAEVSWSKERPGRGGVREQYVCHKPEGGLLRIEIRQDESWMWIEDGGETRVLKFEATDMNGIFEKLNQIEDLPSVGNYLTFMSDLGLPLVAHEQFERTFVNTLPPPGDAAFKFFSDVLYYVGTGEQAGPFHAGLGFGAPPSATTGLRLGLAQLGYEGGPNGASPVVTYDDDEPQWPHPHEARAEVVFSLFKRTKLGWRPKGHKPDEDVVAAISEIANQGYSVAEWTEQAKALGPTLRERWSHLVALMTRGCPIPQGRNAFDWLQRVQIASALTLAHVDDGWEKSLRRRVLVNLVLGRPDWVVTAGLVGLYQIATTTPEARDEIDGLFRFLQRNVAYRGFTTYAMPLSLLWLELGSSLCGEEEMRAWGRDAWQGGVDREQVEGVDLVGYAESIAAKAAGLPTGVAGDEWEARISSDPTRVAELRIQVELAKIRAELKKTDAASAEARALIQRSNSA